MLVNLNMGSISNTQTTKDAHYDFEYNSEDDLDYDPNYNPHYDDWGNELSVRSSKPLPIQREILCSGHVDIPQDSSTKLNIKDKPLLVKVEPEIHEQSQLDVHKHCAESDIEDNIDINIKNETFCIDKELMDEIVAEQQQRCTASDCQDDIISYECDICHKRFKLKRYLAAHMRIHTGKKSHLCDFCQKRFITKYELKLHRRTHTGEKPYECDICQKRFTFNSCLVAHRRAHAGDRTYECSICHIVYTRNSSLVVHKRSHTGEKPYQCDICPSGFTRNSGLKVHMRTHTGEKPYECEICHQRFNCNSNLNVHKRSHHMGGKPHQCDVCQTRFSQRVQRTVHMLIHAGKAPYECDICETEFNRKDKLIVHVRSHRRKRLSFRRKWWDTYCDVLEEEVGVKIAPILLRMYDNQLTGELGNRFTSKEGKFCLDRRFQYLLLLLDGRLTYLRACFIASCSDGRSWWRRTKRMTGRCSSGVVWGDSACVDGGTIDDDALRCGTSFSSADDGWHSNDEAPSADNE